jgi:hypothetical protein
MADLTGIDIFEGPISVGEHTLQMLLNLQGNGYGTFAYLKSYHFEPRSSHRFTAIAGKTILVQVVAYEKGGRTTQLEDRLAVRYQEVVSDRPLTQAQDAGPNESRSASDGGASSASSAPGSSDPQGARDRATGLPPEEIRHVVMRHLDALRACYEPESERNQDLKGGMNVEWKIARDGTVDGVQIAEVDSSLSSTDLRLCVMREIVSWRFPTSARPSTVKWPFRFGVQSPTADGGAHAP